MTEGDFTPMSLFCHFSLLTTGTAGTSLKTIFGFGGATNAGAQILGFFAGGPLISQHIASGKVTIRKSPI